METTQEQAQQFIDARPHTCYRTLEKQLMAAHPDLTWQDDRYMVYLAEKRPECGYDCDERCPVSGNAEP